MNKIWKPVKDFEGFYVVSDDGEVRSVDREIKVGNIFRKIKGQLLKTRINNRGYLDIRLHKDGNSDTFFVHRLVAAAYVNNPLNKPYVNHINGVKTDNRSCNVEWVTQSENMHHAYKTGLFKTPYSKCRSVVDICTGERFESIRQAALQRNMDYATCKNYLKGRRRNPTCLRYDEEKVYATAPNSS